MSENLEAAAPRLRGQGGEMHWRHDVMLGQSQIAHYLLSLGLVEPRAVLEDGLTVVDASRRNCVFIATTRSGPTYAIKQAGPRSVLTLEHEAWVLRVLADAPELARQVPTVVHEDREMALLVLSSPGGGRDWGEHHKAGSFPLSPARALGRGLAALHRHAVDAVGDQPADVERMWALQFAEPSLELMRDLSAGAQDLMARLQSNPAMIDRLSGLRGHDHQDVFVHGDLRWDNCLAIAPPGSRRRTHTLLVDWELAGRGEAALDVGTVLAEYLSAWVGSIPIAEVAAPGRLLSHAKYPLRRMRPAIDAFWSAYCEPSSTPPTLRRVLELAAVRLLQTAVERAQVLAAPTAHLVTLLQLAENVLLEPEKAAHTLLGLRA
jgi:aminoglycoside phosphotransferase (APT) family kinase protein